jgi:aryl-alcohol dehydrogenase-like predicted oxidoreductase
VAVAWLLSQPVITAPIIGANTLEQLAPNLAAVDIELSEAQVAKLTKSSDWTEG